MQWILIGYAAISSTGFLLVNFWKELDRYITNRKYFMLGLIIICQFIIFMMLKLYFFGQIQAALSITTTSTTATATSASVSTSTGHA